MSDPDLRTAIREYLEIADTLFQREVQEGLISIHEAKQDTAEMEKWRELLNVLEASDILYGGPR